MKRGNKIKSTVNDLDTKVVLTSSQHWAHHMEFLYSVHVQANFADFYLQMQTISNIITRPIKNIVVIYIVGDLILMNS